jgi:hypothetical protein
MTSTRTILAVLLFLLSLYAATGFYFEPDIVKHQPVMHAHSYSHNAVSKNLVVTQVSK